MESINSEATAKLAEFFGTTTNKIIENTPTFLSKYGWYMTVKDIYLIPIVAVLVTFIGTGLYTLITDVIDLDDSGTKIIRVAFIIFVVTVVILLIADYTPLFIAPELVGLERLLESFN